jgi:DNA-binding NarL/FixJ family response regulator
VPVPELTPIEERIVLLVAEGRSVEAIAADLGVRARTVDWHLVRARRKLERATTLRERAEKAHRAAAQGGMQ